MSFLTNIENKHKNDDRFTKHFWLKLSSQNTRNGVFELQHFQIFWRSMPPYPLAARALDVCVIGLFKNIAIRNLGWTVWSLSNLTNHFLGIWYSVSRQFQVFGIQDFLSPPPPLWLGLFHMRDKSSLNLPALWCTCGSESLSDPLECKHGLSILNLNNYSKIEA